MREKKPSLFRLQENDPQAISVRVDPEEVIHHEVLSEEDVNTIRDHPAFVGRDIPGSRIQLARLASCLILCILLARAGWMQVVDAQEFQVLSDENRFRSVVVPARRGIILDRNGVILAENTPSFDVRMRWIDLPSDEEDRNTIIALVARTVGVTSDDILQILQDPNAAVDEWMDVAKDLSYERALDLAVQLPDIPGVALVTGTKRSYPESLEVSSLSHVLGYVGSISAKEYAERRELGYRRTDVIGKTGIEKSYESRIRGTQGLRRIEVDALGRPRALISEDDPVDGEEIHLTLDLGLQKAAEEAIKTALEKAEASRGSAVVMDPRDGSILALVSYPAYDNNLFAGTVSSTVYAELINDSDNPLFPRSVAGRFPSGSTIKPLIATAALEEGIITPNTLVFSSGGIQVGPWFFPDWAAGGHGATNVRRAIAWSVNTFFYYVGGGYESFHGLGVERLQNWMSRFGLGKPTGVDLPGEASGLVPSEEWKVMNKGERWYIGDTYNLSIGQGDLLVTPLQMTLVSSIIANSGTKVRPHVVQGSEEVLDTIDVDANNWETIRLGMRDTIVYGSARSLYSSPVPIAGKTGTAQWRTDRPNHAWFTGFAPYDDPEVVVTIILEEGEQETSYAVRAAGDIFRMWYAQRAD